MAVVWNILIARNRASADFMISSPLVDGDYEQLVPDYDVYRTRKIAGTWPATDRTPRRAGVIGMPAPTRFERPPLPAGGTIGP
jgi:hypothetical protein